LIALWRSGAGLRLPFTSTRSDPMEYRSAQVESISAVASRLTNSRQHVPIVLNILHSDLNLPSRAFGGFPIFVRDSETGGFRSAACITRIAFITDVNGVSTPVRAAVYAQCQRAGAASVPVDTEAYRLDANLIVGKSERWAPRSGSSLPRSTRSPLLSGAVFRGYKLARGPKRVHTIVNAARKECVRHKASTNVSRRGYSPVECTVSRSTYSCEDTYCRLRAEQ
jgi:hypothetical protein